MYRSVIRYICPQCGRVIAIERIGSSDIDIHSVCHECASSNFDSERSRDWSELLL